MSDRSPSAGLSLPAIGPESWFIGRNHREADLAGLNQEKIACIKLGAGL
jgi:hypothetical protein